MNPAPPVTSILATVVTPTPTDLAEGPGLSAPGLCPRGRVLGQSWPFGCVVLPASALAVYWIRPVTADNGVRLVRLNVRACTHHVGDVVQALTVWARNHHTTDGHLIILIIDPPQCSTPPGFPDTHRQPEPPGVAFTTIPLDDGHLTSP
jgi:hypothetical protein